MSRGYRDLRVWQHAMELVKATYNLTAKLPPLERFALTDQIRRCAISIPANLAEGHARQQLGDFLRFVRIARGSLAELETHIELALALDYVSSDQAAETLTLAGETGRMLSRLASSLAERRSSGPHPCN